MKKAPVICLSAQRRKMSSFSIRSRSACACCSRRYSVSIWKPAASISVRISPKGSHRRSYSSYSVVQPLTRAASRPLRSCSSGCSIGLVMSRLVRQACRWCVALASSSAYCTHLGRASGSHWMSRISGRYVALPSLPSLRSFGLEKRSFIDTLGVLLAKSAPTMAGSRESELRLYPRAVSWPSSASVLNFTDAREASYSRAMCMVSPWKPASRTPARSNMCRSKP
mmetsp:Transcript_1343/g.3939  ORF Transcript_1343/g.3939 Transcript_1343/m.3939 type:complete len:225 (+) Transcript_1343:70-744(+)